MPQKNKEVLMAIPFRIDNILSVLEHESHVTEIVSLYKLVERKNKESLYCI